MKAIECAKVSQGGSYIAIPEEFEYKVTPVTEETKWALMPRVRPLHEKLGLEPSRTEREVFNNLREGTEVGILKKLRPDSEGGPEDIAFVAQSLEDFYVSGRRMRVLSIAAKVVVPDYQHHQFGTYMAQEAICRLHPEAVTGRTPNPYAMRTYERTGFIRRMHPIDAWYPTEIRTALAYLIGGRRIAGVDDLRTGLCRAVYPRGEERTFDREGMSEKVARIYSIMTGPIGANLEEGDGIRYWAVVDKRGQIVPSEATALVVSLVA